MKVWKKLAGVVLALAVMMSLTVSAWAAVDNTKVITSSNAFADNDPQTAIQGTSFTVAVSYSGSGYVAEGTTTFEIQKTLGTSLANNNDAVTFDVPTTPGDYARTADNGFHVATVTTPAGQLTASNTVTLNLAFGSGLQPDTDKSYAKYYINGVDDDYSLYIYFKTSSGSKVPYAAVLVDEGVASAVTDDMTGEFNANAKKPGFAVSTNSNNRPTGTVTITKAVAGDSGNKATGFPFRIWVKCPDIAGATSFQYTATLDDNNTPNAWIGSSSSGSLTTTVTYATDMNSYFDAQLGDGDTIVISALPYDAVVYVQETYATGDYQITSAVEGGDADSYGSISSAVTTPGAQLNEGVPLTFATVAESAATITVTNTREAISPTGVVLRFAPYLAMLGAGLTTMVIAPRRKEEE